MNDLLARLRSVYVEPRREASPNRMRTLAPAPCAAVLGAGREAAAGAATLALSLARTGSWPCALVALWRAGDGPACRLPARAPARRLRAGLRALDIEAHASGRLVVVVLPQDAAEAAATAERATAIVRGPVALALSGPRDGFVDGLLRLQDVVVLLARPGDDPAVADLAEASLRGLAAPIMTCEAAVGSSGRALALAGGNPPVGLRRALAPALRAVA